MLNRSSILNISVLCLWNSAGGRCLKLIELKTAIDHLERHLNIAKELEDIFEENKRGFGGKSCTFLFRRIWRTYSRQVSRKTVAKSLADGVVQLAIPGGYIMRISYDSATVNIFIFIEQRSISFQNDISLKNHEIGSLVVRKVKWNCGTHGRIVSLDQLEGRRAIADLFVMFIAWTSQKASNVHKLLSQSWP